MKLSVIVPAFRAKSTIGACLTALVLSLDENDEIIVVDDGSDDGTDATVLAVQDSRITLIRLSKNIGRGPARNRAASRATGDVLVFVDADVVVHRDTLQKIRHVFVHDATTAIIGSYDDSPADPGSVSQFRNLLHYFTHQTSGATSSHFFTGLSAVRSGAFQSVGGFSERRWSRNMEDVEFGHRLTDAGHAILVRPEIQGIHLRPYTLVSMVRSDLFDRAIPWTRLTFADRRTDKFVLSGSRLISGTSVCLFPLFLLATLLTKWGFLGAVSTLLAFAVSQRKFWSAMVELRGLKFLVRVIPLSYVHIATATLGFGLGFTSACLDFVRNHVRRKRHPRGSGQGSLPRASSTMTEMSSSEK